MQTRPSQTWAYEQFGLAREEARKGLFPEALESLHRSINGHGSNIGFKTEFRFHFLVGQIRLGSSEDFDAEVICPAKAETAFCLAARYAQTDHPAEAGNALVSAGRAAFVQGKISVALQHTVAGLELEPQHAHGQYQAARLYALTGDTTSATEALARAVALNPILAVSAVADGEFARSEPIVENGLREAKSRLSDIFDHHRGVFCACLEMVQDIESYEVTPAELVPARICEINLALSQADSDMRSDTILGVGSGIDRLWNRRHVFAYAEYEHGKALLEWLESEQTFTNRELGNLSVHKMELNDSVVESEKGLKESKFSAWDLAQFAAVAVAIYTRYWGFGLVQWVRLEFTQSTRYSHFHIRRIYCTYRYGFHGEKSAPA